MFLATTLMSLDFRNASFAFLQPLEKGLNTELFVL